jgi:hypothetical protein
MDRIAHWKSEFERCWREGDRRGMAKAEAMLESWRLAQAEGIVLVEQEEIDGQQTEH